MATHQQLANVSDQDLVQRMVSSYPERFDFMFWEYFKQHFEPTIEKGATLLDIGCGPGLFLKDLRARYPEARLVGTDLTEAMIDHARQLTYEGNVPEYHVHNIEAAPLPLDDASADFVSMVAVLHVLDDPFPVLTEIRRVMAPGARFMLQDWIRTPLPIYLERMLPSNLDQEQRGAIKGRFLPLFTVHNKYAKDDWLWILHQAGFSVEHRQEIRSPHFCTFVCSVK